MNWLQRKRAEARERREYREFALNRWRLAYMKTYEHNDADGQILAEIELAEAEAALPEDTFYSTLSFKADFHQSRIDARKQAAFDEWKASK